MADNVSYLPQGLLSPATLRKIEPEPTALPPGIDITLIDEANDNVSLDPTTGALMIKNDDGSVIIDFNPQAPGKDREAANKFNANLAEHITDDELGRICSDLLRGIQFDDASRREWLETRAEGIKILGLKIDPPRTSIDSTASLEGMSNIRHPMLLEATLRFQANARGELLPSDGPVKVVDKLTHTTRTDDLAEKLEDGLNYYLTEVATEYYPDTDRMLLYVGFGGCGFKKVYNCPLRRRPVSESIDAADLIVSNAATDMKNSGRVTHQITMRPSVLKRMQLVGAYRKVGISMPSGVVPNAVQREVADTQGVDPIAQQTEDRDHTIYECYCELDIRGFEHKENGVPTGLPLPYRVVIEKDSQQILEVRRNWDEKDETQAAKICFVKYPYVPGLGFYDIGLIHILGNTTNSLTAAWREMLDAGMFANFPGFLYAKIMGRQNTNEFRIPPGGGAPIETNGQKIGDAVMPLPYKDISPAFSAFIEMVDKTAQRVGGTAEVQISEGRADAPVGTTLALIEQATKIEGAVHKRIHTAQAEEFQLLKECFRENPGSFINAMNMRGQSDWDETGFLEALDSATLSPQADPNTPSHMHRIMKAMGLIQLDKAYPGKLDPDKLLKRVTSMMKIDDFDSLLAPPQGPQGIPPEIQLKLAELAQKKAELEAKPQIMQMQAAQDREQYQHEDQIQARESADQQDDRRNRAMIASMSFRESMMDNQAQLADSRMDIQKAMVEARSDEHSSDNTVKVAGHATQQAQHAIKEAEAKAKGEEHKAKAAARKPKPGAKKK